MYMYITHVKRTMYKCKQHKVHTQNMQCPKQTNSTTLTHKICNAHTHTNSTMFTHKIWNAHKFKQTNKQTAQCTYRNAAV